MSQDPRERDAAESLMGIISHCGPVTFDQLLAELDRHPLMISRLELLSQLKVGSREPVNKRSLVRGLVIALHDIGLLAYSHTAGCEGWHASF